MRDLLILLFLLCLAQPAWAQLQGRVFEDTNQNDRQDGTEKGLPGVVVSNQYTVVLTDSAGYYRFEDGRHLGSVTVSMPAGYTGNFWQPVVGNSPGSYNFALRPVEDKRRFRFIHASDTHLQPNNRHRMIRFREMTDSIQPDFVLITGDLVKDALRVGEAEASSYYRLYVDEIAKFGMPVYSVPGNHEIFGIERHHSLVSKDHPLYGKQMYRHYLGPTYYSFNYGGLHFVGLDAVSYDDLWYYGDIDEVQLRWLEQDLRHLPAEMPVVPFNHIALVSPGFGLGGFQEGGVAPTLIKVKGKNRYRHLVGNATEVIALLRNHPFPLALAGHFHSAQSATFETQGNKTLFAQTSAITGPSTYYYAGMKVTSGFTLYEVDAGQIKNAQFIPLDKVSSPAVSLFNGKDLTGWHVDVPEMDKNPDARNPFIVRDGKLVSLGTPNGHLITDKSYQNYRLEVEYRFAGEPGNCGVLVHASTPRALYEMFPKSLEVQMMHENAGDFWCIVEDIKVPDMEARRGPPAEWGITEGKKRRILNLTDGSEKPPGEWNRMVIECVDRSIKVWVNGDLVNYGYDCTAGEGQIAVQAEGSEVEFRKLELTPISELTE